ncbi:putative ubiquinone biosynthesis monooxygenase [Elasticomyces elasticus]|nr:putative ubiquinone biosynthesis monooxygenase [Elasticomyces elasticus]
MPLRLPSFLALPAPLRHVVLRNPQRTLFWSPPTPEPVETVPPQGPEIYDIVCVGGGPAGLGLLGALRANDLTKDLKIAVIEGQNLESGRWKKAQYGVDVQGYANRCSSLTPKSVAFLNSIGAWHHIRRSRTQPYHSMRVWDGVSGSRIVFDSAETSLSNNGGPASFSLISALTSSIFPQRPRSAEPDMDPSVVATMTENQNITSALLSNLDEHPSVDTLDQTRVENIELGEETEDVDMSGWPILTLQYKQRERKLAARLLVGADGANSPVRNFAGIPSRGWDYNRHGVVATLQLSPQSVDEHRTAYQRFLPTGPIALLPLPGPYASLVWSTTPAHAAKLKALQPEDFVAMVNAAFRLTPTDLEYLHTIPSGQTDEVSWRQQHTPALTVSAQDGRPWLAHGTDVVGVQPGSIASFPLRMRHADTYTGHRVALLGDAAHTIHPLAGQGLNQGLGDAQSLAACIAKAVATGGDIGSSWTLDGYNAERWAANNAIMGTVDKLHKLYSAGSGPVVWARSLGLDMVNRLDHVKGFLMRQAAGR